MRKTFEIRIGRDFAKDMGQFLVNPKLLDKEPRVVRYIDSFEVLAAILSPERLKLLQTLKQKPNCSVNQLAEQVGRKREAVSRDLKLLSSHDMIKLQKNGKHVHIQANIDELVIKLNA
ncbi:MAG: helix-turn-helix domain-containing protein [Candidatus Diapherotrites archaeon]|nr:helix-turn-helix domain-containing protein [Candidatus Diapherotrites archaeon]